MKRFSGAALFAAMLGLGGLLLFFACKDQKKPPIPEITTLDAILKDVPAEAYSLNFQDLPANRFITKNSYGSLAEGMLLDNDDICPPLKPWGYKKFPPIIVPPRIGLNTLVPNKLIVQPTCPEFVPINLRDNILALIKQSGWQYAQELQSVKAGDKALLASNSLLREFQSIQPDRMDMEGMKGVNVENVFVAIPEANFQANERGPDLFSRGWYGVRWGNLRLPPKYYGCFDPIDLKRLRENLVALDRAQFSRLQIKEVDAKVAQLSF